MPKTSVKFWFRRVRRRVFGAERRFRGLSNQQIFDRIYSENLWGKTPDGSPCSGPGSHDPDIVAAYVAAVRPVLARLGDAPVIADLGCGDFHVSSHLVAGASRYIACDVAETVVRANRDRWQMPNVEFRALDLTRDDLPQADVAIVRQVLQHVGNEGIARFVAHVNRHRPFRHMIVTEHLYRGRGFVPNRYKPSGSSLRVQVKSGVVPEADPFNLQFLEREILQERAEPIWDLDAVIRTTHYTLA